MAVTFSEPPQAEHVAADAVEMQNNGQHQQQPQQQQQPGRRSWLRRRGDPYPSWSIIVFLCRPVTLAASIAFVAIEAHLAVHYKTPLWGPFAASIFCLLADLIGLSMPFFAVPQPAVFALGGCDIMGGGLCALFSFTAVRGLTEGARHNFPLTPEKEAAEPFMEVAHIYTTAMMCAVSET